MQDHDNEAMKEAVKAALKEWLDEKLLQFGKWSLTAISAAALVALVYFILSVNGWSHGPSSLPITTIPDKLGH